MTPRKTAAEKEQERAEATAGGAAGQGTEPQPSAAKDGGEPKTREQEAATEAQSPQESKVAGADPSIHDNLLALEQFYANVPLVESERRPDLADLDKLDELLKAAGDSVAAERKRQKAAG